MSEESEKIALVLKWTKGIAKLFELGCTKP